jgi:hypothetical protein
VSVADFQGALNQLMDYSSNLITNELRAALRDVRTKWQPKKRTARARG